MEIDGNYYGPNQLYFQCQHQQHPYIPGQMMDCLEECQDLQNMLSMHFLLPQDHSQGSRSLRWYLYYMNLSFAY